MRLRGRSRASERCARAMHRARNRNGCRAVRSATGFPSEQPTCRPRRRWRKWCVSTCRERRPPSAHAASPSAHAHPGPLLQPPQDWYASRPGLLLVGQLASPPSRSARRALTARRSRRPAPPPPSHTPLLQAFAACPTWASPRSSTCVARPLAASLRAEDCSSPLLALLLTPAFSRRCSPSVLSLQRTTRSVLSIQTR